MEYAAIVKHRGEWWIGWIEEVPGVNSQERTHEELMYTLAETLSGAIELNRQDPCLLRETTNLRRRSFFV